MSISEEKEPASEIRATQKATAQARMDGRSQPVAKEATWEELERDWWRNVRLRGFAIGCSMRVKRQEELVTRKRKAMEKALAAYELAVSALKAEQRLEEGAMLAYSDDDEEFALIVEQVIG